MYCPNCNSSNIGSKTNRDSYSTYDSVTTTYYCKDCGKEISRDTKREDKKYPKDPKKDKWW